MCVALVIQHARRTDRNVACLALPYFPHYFLKDTIFEEKLFNIKCVFRFSVQLSSETFLTITRIKRDIIIIVHRL